MKDLLGPALVQAAQGLSALAWVAEAIYFFSVSRRLLRRASPLSIFAVLLALLGWTQAAFTARWYIWHGTVTAMGQAETSAWVTLYLLSSVEAATLVLAARAYRRLLP